MFITFVNSLIVLSTCIIIGYIGRKVGVLTDNLNAGLSTFLLKIALPCTVFISLMRPFSYALLLESLATIIISLAVFMFGFCIGIVLARLMGASDDEKRIWQFSLMFANVGYMGFPVIYAIYGYEGLIYTTMSLFAFNILAFSLGIGMFQKGSGSIKTVLLNPVLVFTYIGFIFFVTGIRLPGNVQDGIELIGAMTVPLSMLLVGAILAKSRLLSLITDFRLLPVIFLRLIGIPVVIFFVLRNFIPNQMMLEIIVILAAMPVAAITVIFAEQYNSNTALASKTVAVSSLLCLLSIPLISLLLY